MEPGIVLNEAELIERAAAGDRSAFGEIYTRYLDAIYRYIFYRVGDTHDAEDLTEMVFLRAWQAIADYKDLGVKFSCWLYRIAHNIVVDFHRRRVIDPCISDDLNDVDEKMAAQLMKQVDEVEEASALAQAITKLNDEQQQVIMLRFVEGFSHAEVAKIMDKTEGACRMLQNRALVALNHLLNGI